MRTIAYLNRFSVKQEAKNVMDMEETTNKETNVLLDQHSEGTLSVHKKSSNNFMKSKTRKSTRQTRLSQRKMNQNNYQAAFCKYTD